MRRVLPFVLIATAVLVGAYVGFVALVTQGMSGGEDIADVVGIKNRTGGAISIQALTDSGEWLSIEAWAPPDLDQGSMTITGDRYARQGCTFRPVRAVDGQHRELERRRPPLCDGDTWIVDGVQDTP